MFNHFCFHNQKNSTSSPGLLGLWRINLQLCCSFDVVSWLTGLLKFFQIWSTVKPVMVNYACAFSQSKTEKYFEWIVIEFIEAGFISGGRIIGCVFLSTGRWAYINNWVRGGGGGLIKRQFMVWLFRTKVDKVSVHYASCLRQDTIFYDRYSLVLPTEIF